jgi:hypothetical protein
MDLGRGSSFRTKKADCIRKSDRLMQTKSPTGGIGRGKQAVLSVSQATDELDVVDRTSTGTHKGESIRTLARERHQQLYSYLALAEFEDDTNSHAALTDSQLLCLFPASFCEISFHT